MWKLFPTSWIEDAGLPRQRLAAWAEALERNWLGWLEDALRRVSPHKLAEHPSDPVQGLRALTGSQLLRLDEALRTGRSLRTPQTPPYSSTPPDSGEVTLADAYLFVAACNSNGFVRERAVITLARYPGPLAFAAGLIRSADWVAQVRKAAISLVTSVTPHMAPSDLVRFLDLMVQLKDRARVDAGIWRSIEQKLGDARETLRTAARDQSNSSLLRRAALEYWMLGDPGKVPQILESALADPDPRIGLWALAQSNGLREVEVRASLLNSALRARHAAVRRTALRQYATSNPNVGLVSLRAALFDPSRGVRSFAAFELNRRHGESALPIWRAALDDSRQRVSEVATLALCESGEREDVESIASDGMTRTAFLRAAILRGLWRVGSPLLEAHLTPALLDSSTRVVRQVAEIYRRGTLALACVALEDALARAGDSLAPTLIALADVLGKWDGLELLLRLASAENIGRAECAAAHVDRWILTANRRFTAPPSQQVQRLIRLSRDAQARHPQRNWRSLDFDLAAFT